MAKLKIVFFAMVMTLHFASNLAQEWMTTCVVDPAGDPPCNQKKHFSCLQPNPPNPATRCICDKTISYHGTVNGEDMCIREQGKPCLEWLSSGYPTACTPNSRCIQSAKDANGTCECLSSAIPSTGGLCLGGFSSQCMHHQDCATDKFLDCGSNNTCVCSEDNMEWNDASKICQSLLGGSCDLPPANTKTCVSAPGVICAENAGQGRCACDTAAGYVNHPDEPRCVKRFDESCTTDSECLPTNVCVGPEGLKKCGCDSNLITENNECKLKAGDECGAEVQFQCHSNSACNSTTTPATCTCNDNFAPNSGNVCKLNHGATCTAPEANLCNAELHLTCQAASGGGMACECKDTYEYVTDKCLGNFEAICNVDEDCKTGTCTDAPDKKCGCPAGTITGPNTCYLSFDAECSDSIEWKCNPSEYTDCIGNRCTCNAESTVQNGACAGLVDGSCEDERKCVTNAQCVRTDSGSVCRCTQDYVKNTTTSLCVQRGSSGSWALSGSIFAVVVSIFVALSK